MAGLGKGLDSLMPSGFDVSLLTDEKDRVQKLFIKEISPRSDQPRRTFDEQALAELASSIKRFGILQPLIVSPAASGYEIIAGERRWRAAQLAGLETVPGIIRKPEEQERLEIALIENVQRVDLSPIEQAVSIERLHQQFNLSYQDISKRLGKAATTVNNIVRLLQLPQDARAALEGKKITEGHARAILALKDSPEKQIELIELLLEHGWSVRQAEQFVSGVKAGLAQKKTIEKRVAKETPQTKAFSEKLHTPVTVRHTAKGGRVEIHFKNDEDLERIFKQLL